jgi:hypothetical protein
MELNPTLLSKSMDVQLQTLIVDAFRCLSPLPQRSYVVIIDGLDECHDKATQESILRLLCETIIVHKLPLRFLIGSRPEPQIRDSFDQESLHTITRRVVLDETFNPGRDIRVFLQDGFAKICAKNSILSHVKQPWPEEGIIDLLVQRSSGQFIYAATVVKFVGADFCSPTKQLALVLKSDPTAFSDLDQLYTQILSVYPSAVLTRNLSIQSLTESSSTNHLIPEEIFGCFCMMALRKSVKVFYPSCFMAPGQISHSCNDHRASSSTRRLSSNTLKSTSPFFFFQGIGKVIGSGVDFN